MQQSYWNFAANLWALAVSTTIALFLPDFGPSDRMSQGIGVVIRTTMVAPIVFTLMYATGRLISFLAQRWIVNLFMLGIQHGIENAAERRAKKIVEERGEEIARQIAQDRAEEIARQHVSEDIAQRRIEEIAQRAAKETAERVVEEIAGTGPFLSFADREKDHDEFRRFMRSKGVSEEEIDAFIGRLAQQD